MAELQTYRYTYVKQLIIHFSISGRKIGKVQNTLATIMTAIPLYDHFDQNTSPQIYNSQCLPLPSYMASFEDQVTSRVAITSLAAKLEQTLLIDHINANDGNSPL